MLVTATSPVATTSAKCPGTTSFPSGSRDSEPGPENSGWLSDNAVIRTASSIPGLRVPQRLEDSGSAAVKADETRFDQQAAADAVSATPTILVGRTGQTPRPVTLTSARDGAPVQAAIAAALR